MFKSVNRISVLKFIGNDGLTFSPRSTGWIQIYRRCSGLKEMESVESEKTSYDMNFTTFMQQRQDQAKRSFFAKLQNLEDCKKLFLLCKQHGAVKTAFHYEQQNSHILLVEMFEEKNMNVFLNKINKTSLCCGYNNQFIIVRNVGDPVKNIKKTNGVNFINTSMISSRKFLNTELSKKEPNLNDLIKKCYSYLKIGEYEIRKKFLMCRAIELLTGGFLPGAVAYPFGSSVSGFGMNGSDLDIALLSHQNNLDFTNLNVEIVRKHLAIISDVIEHFSDWSSDVFFVRNARVPIVKFRNKLSDVDCDLSLYNSHGIAMSQMNYTLASFDWRIRALVIFIKLWAQKVGIVSKVPGTKLSSFSVSVLVIFFLQQIEMLPPLNIFPCRDNQFLLKGDDFIPESVLIKEKQRCNNDTSVEKLCKMFFEFYKTFNFHKFGISIKEGKTITNIEKYPLFIENPIYEGVNVSSNVKNYDILDIQDLLNDATEILNGERVSEKIRRIFSLSLKNKGHVQKFGQS